MSEHCKKFNKKGRPKDKRSKHNKRILILTEDLIPTNGRMSCKSSNTICITENFAQDCLIAEQKQ